MLATLLIMAVSAVTVAVAFVLLFRVTAEKPDVEITPETALDNEELGI